MDIDRSEFATECVRQGLRFGVNPHFLLATGHLRSGIRDDRDDGRFSVYRISQAEWDANCSDAEYEINDFLSEDVQFWDMQCVIYALMTRRSQDKFLARSERYPSAVELYIEQWPSHQAKMPDDLQNSLNATADLLKPAVVSVLGNASASSPAIGDASSSSVADTSLDQSKLVPAQGEQTFIIKASRIMMRLIDDFALKDFQAAGVLGNIGHECAGFRLMQEVKPLGGGKGGFGWCQWTGSRRVEFEKFCEDRGLDRTSDAGNYGFLKLELETSHRSSLTALRTSANIKDAVRFFEQEFERAHKDHKHYARRDRWASLALAHFERQLPTAVAGVLDPDLYYVVSGTATDGFDTYWLVDQFTEGGEQILVRLSASKEATVLANDAPIFPLPAGTLPAKVEKELREAAGNVISVDNTGVPGSVEAASVDEIAQRVFEEAEKANGSLVSRRAPGTSNGRLACAWAVNEIVRRAVGTPVGGGLSTAKMSEALRNKHRAIKEGEAGRGSIIISPTVGRNVGHVGILGENNVVYSNSSNRGVFSDNFTLSKWKSFYGNKKGLSVLFFGLEP